MMNIRTLNLFVLMSATVFGSAGVQAADLKAGQSLHDANCMKCHDSSVYTRDDRMVSSLDGLRKQVKRCDASLGLTWFDDQVEDVVHYLNTTYYNFK